MEKEIKMIDALSLAMCTNDAKNAVTAILGMHMHYYECITLYPGSQEKDASIEFWRHNTLNSKEFKVPDWVIIKIDPFGHNMATIGHNVPEEIQDFLKGRQGQKPKSLFIEE